MVETRPSGTGRRRLGRSVRILLLLLGRRRRRRREGQDQGPGNSPARASRSRRPSSGGPVLFPDAALADSHAEPERDRGPRGGTTASSLATAAISARSAWERREGRLGGVEIPVHDVEGDARRDAVLRADSTGERFDRHDVHPVDGVPGLLRREEQRVVPEHQFALDLTTTLANVSSPPRSTRPRRRARTSPTRSRRLRARGSATSARMCSSSAPSCTESVRAARLLRRELGLLSTTSTTPAAETATTSPKRTRRWTTASKRR